MTRSPRHAIGVLLLAFAALSPLTARAEPFNPPATGRVTVPLSADWKFFKGDPADARNADFDDKAWDAVSLPHTWNNRDGQDGPPAYYRGPGWYRHHVTLDKSLEGKQLFLRFEGANRTTEVYVNGLKAGEPHTGGFAAFVVPITLKAGDNVLAVKVDNKHNPDSPPLSADFTFCGGLYREVSLLGLPPRISISPLDLGSPGVYVRTPKIAADKAEVEIQALLQGSRERALDNAHLAAIITDAAGQVVARAESEVEVAGPAARPVLKATIPNPHLWNGRKDPYLYRVHVLLNPSADGKKADDKVSVPLGLRTFAVDPQKGFLLNGKPYDLHGVNRHQDWLDKGWAIGPKEMDADMALIKELGCTTVRLAHYQHPQYFYDLCDKEGIVVWAELALVNSITDNQAFKDNARQQLQELIRQNFNHPSIAFWSLCNEITLKKGPDPWPLIAELNDLAHKEDPARLTTHAIVGGGPKSPVSDVWAYNRYFGWYGNGKPEDVVAWLDKQPGTFGMSEYGAGSSVLAHAEQPRRMDHTEEYQCLYHETYWRAMKDRPNVWGKFIWVFADFASDGRKEGDHMGRNDKGLVTIDRKIKKDAFYFYKANWSEEPTVHLASKRFATRGVAKIPVKVYANCSQVELIVNGQNLGKAKGDTGVFLWPQVQLKEGLNTVEAKGQRDGKTYTDTCTWTYKPGAATQTGTDTRPASTQGLGQ